MRFRLLPGIIMGLAVLVSVGAVNALAGVFGLGVETWYGPLKSLNWVYTDLHDKTFGAINQAANNRFGINIPASLSHVLVLYLAAAFSFVSGSAGLAQRENMVETAKATGLGALLPLAIPVFLWQAIRMRVVSKFARENTLSFFGYILLVAGAYGASIWANGAVYGPNAGDGTQPQTVQRIEAEQGAATTRDEIMAIGAMDRAAAAGRIDAGKIDSGRGDAAVMEGIPASVQEARALADELGQTLMDQTLRNGAVSDQSPTVQTLPQQVVADQPHAGTADTSETP